MILNKIILVLCYNWHTGHLRQCHNGGGGGFRVGGGVHDSYTLQCGLVGYFTSPGIDTDRRDRRLLVSPPKDTGKAG